MGHAPESWVSLNCFCCIREKGNHAFLFRMMIRHTMNRISGLYKCQNGNRFVTCGRLNLSKDQTDNWWQLRHRRKALFWVLLNGLQAKSVLF